MLSKMKVLFLCLKGPNLYRIYSNTSAATSEYKPMSIEKLAGRVISVTNTLVGAAIYICPLFLAYNFYKGNLKSDVLSQLSSCGLVFLIVYTLSHFIQALCRYHQIDYKNFIKLLSEIKPGDLESIQRKKLQNFDFDFSAWPLDYPKSKLRLGERIYPHELRKPSFLTSILNLPYNLAGYLLVNSFGRKMLYPGSIKFLSNLVLVSSIQYGRANLTLKFNGQRYKVQTRDDVELDTMFIDQRRDSENGNFLVICCEGNAGFYEIGIMESPLDAGFSVLGWNTPGFAGSSGHPDPKLIANSMDAVIQFGLSLGFSIEKIILYGWSIGGFPVAWAAVNYPEVHSVVLDATFDDLIPLATPRFPDALSGFVEYTIRNYLNLNIGDHLVRYTGPLILIRRLKDEIITTENGVISTNVINNLCYRILSERYPVVMGNDYSKNAVQEFLASENPRDVLEDINIKEMEALYHEHTQIHSEIPSDLGTNFDSNQKRDMASYLASKYLYNLDASHCTPLHSSIFNNLVKSSRNGSPHYWLNDELLDSLMGENLDLDDSNVSQFKAN